MHRSLLGAAVVVALASATACSSAHLTPPAALTTATAAQRGATTPGLEPATGVRAPWGTGPSTSPTGASAGRAPTPSPPIPTRPPAPRLSAGATSGEDNPVQPTRSSVAPRTNLGGDSHPIVAQAPFGTIEIPKIGLDHPIYEGVELENLHWGPGHWPGTAMPGQFGNAVFAGHRVTHTRPFLDIDRLQPGDQIIFTTSAGRFVYEVTDHEIVTADNVRISEPTLTPTVTVFACHPKGSARQRYVVHGRLIG
jgi:sortase A